MSLEGRLRLARPIEHQQQPTPFSCTTTCIAMAVGIPVAELGVRLDRPFDFRHFGAWLAQRGIWLRPCFFGDGRGEDLAPGRVYLVAARSLNTCNSDHAMLLDTRRDKDLVAAGVAHANGRDPEERLFEPNRGRAGINVWTYVCKLDLLEMCELVDVVDSRLTPDPREENAA